MSQVSDTANVDGLVFALWCILTVWYMTTHIHCMPTLLVEVFT